MNERHHLPHVLKIDTNTYCLRKDHAKIKKNDRAGGFKCNVNAIIPAKKRV
ncbi:hypothetical protein DESC_10068 [Desulfosarcina cetonica]|nr:hypothetical protein DESC_10068 [Desulfosarcina cetonica]